MKKAEEIQVVSPQLCVWSAYSDDCKCDLSSAAYIHDGSLVLVDPIRLADEAWKDLLKLGEPRVILLTSGNHLRDADYYRKLCRIPVAASVDTRHELGKEIDVVLIGNETVHGLQPINIPGAGPGETAFLSKEGILLLGDAIVNLGGDLQLLPSKHAKDPKQNKESLRKLLGLSFEIVTFAHGLPLTQGAKEKLKNVIG